MGPALSSPGARTHTLAYDTSDRVVGITDPLNRTTTFSYDAADRITTETRPDGAVIAYRYDASGNPASVTPPGQPAHALGYTPIDLETAYTAPLVGNDRDPTPITRPDGLGVAFTYDSAARVAMRATAADPVTFTSIT